LALISGASIRTVHVRLLAFASASDAVGAGELTLELEPGASVGSLKTELERRYPALRGLWHRLAVAVDGEVVEDQTPLQDGAEVALLPPVSGGAGAADRVALVEGTIDQGELLGAVCSASRGAVVLFVGTVRDAHRGRTVERITYSAYPSMARARLERIVGELEAAASDVAVAVIHRLGSIAAGEASVAIAVASPHRQEAYEISRRALERLKAEVPIWKREHYAGGDAAWREEESLAPEPASRA
jgi:molybdopterin synthase catalytic subunit